MLISNPSRILTFVPHRRFSMVPIDSTVSQACNASARTEVRHV